MKILAHLKQIATLMLVAFFIMPPLQAETSLLTPEDIVALKTPLEPQMAPSGKWVAYTVRSNDIKADKRRTQIWMTSADGKTTLPLTGADYDASSPRWSPDGTQLAFLAAKGEDAETQVWLLDMRGGEAQPYSDVMQGVDDFVWSPDGNRMVLVITDPTEAQLEKAKNQDADERARPYIIDRLQFKADYVGYLDRTRAHLYVQDGSMTAPQQLTFGDFDDNGPVWSPDGSKIAFSSNRTHEPDGNTNSDIWTVSSTPAAEPAPLTQVTTNPGADDAPTWSPDGTHIAHTTVIALEKIWYATTHLALSKADGSGTTVLSEKLDRNIFTPTFAADGKHVYVSYEDSGEQQLATIRTKDGKLNRLVQGGLAIYDYGYAGKKGTALTISKPHLPPEVFTYNGGALTQITNLNTDLLAGKTLAEVKNITFPSADGTEIEGFLFLPPGYEKGKRYPTILRIHGGPVAQFDFSFLDSAQILAAKGYVVVISNPRGSSGYGEDFSHALFAEWGVKDFADVNAAVDYAIREGYSDADRLGVGGWSYGGILTNYVITKSDRFEAAISGASEVNHTANYGHDVYQHFWEMELGLPWENRAAWEKINPFNGLQNITTPTLVMGGHVDWNVPIQNSEQLYQVLKRRGIDTELVVYPNEYHGLRRPSFIQDRLERYIGWYDKYLK